jgi:hypothetical protein
LAADRPWYGRALVPLHRDFDRLPACSSRTSTPDRLVSGSIRHSRKADADNQLRRGPLGALLNSSLQPTFKILRQTWLAIMGLMQLARGCVKTHRTRNLSYLDVMRLSPDGKYPQHLSQIRSLHRHDFTRRQRQGEHCRDCQGCWHRRGSLMLNLSPRKPELPCFCLGEIKYLVKFIH